MLNAAFSLRGLTSGALLGGLLLAVFLETRFRRAPILIGMTVSLLVMTAIQVLPAFPQLHVPQSFWPWYALIGTTVMLVVSAIARRLLPQKAQNQIP